MFTPAATDLTVKVTPGSTTSCASGQNYKIVVTPQKTIPTDGLIVVTFPTQIGLTGNSFSSCKSTIGVSSKSLSCSPSSTSPLTVSLSKVFSSFSSG